MTKDTCTNVDETGAECTRPTLEGAPVSLCQIHLVLAAHFTMEMGGLGTGIVATTKKPGARLKYGRPAAVYYLLLGARVKIGTTTDLPQRLRDIPHDRVLAVEPGGNELERQRHREFASLRLQREWFQASPSLIDHAMRIRAQNGDPDAVWASLSSSPDPMRE